MFVATGVGVACRDALWWIGTGSLDFRFGGLSSTGPDTGSWMKGIGSVGGVNVAAAAVAVSAVARFGLRPGHRWAWWFLLFSLLWVGVHDAVVATLFFMKTGAPLMLTPYTYCALMIAGLARARRNPPAESYARHQRKSLHEKDIDMTTTSLRPISDEVASLHRRMADQPASDSMAAFRAEQRALQEAGLPATVARPGTVLPTAELLDVSGQPIASSAVLGGIPTVVVFYRGAWCPYCNLALRAYQRDLVPALRERGVNLVAISPQKPDGSVSVIEANELTFTVASDPGNTLASALGILTAPTEDAQAAQQQLGLDLRAVNADGTTAVPMPTVAIVDADGVLRWIDVHPDYTSRTEPVDVLAALAALDIAGGR